jgi:hypothetical protein
MPMPKSKDIKIVHSVRNTVLRTSHGFAKLTPFTRQAIKSKLNIPKKCNMPAASTIAAFSIQNY